MSYAINTKQAELAVRLVLPSIKYTMGLGLADGEHLHIVVLHPEAKYDPAEKIERSILYEFSVGNKAEWKYPYAEIARSKARITLRTGMPSLYVVQCAPHLLHFSDTKYGGSAYLDGIVVACSGVQEHFDEMFSMWIASAIKGLALERMQEIRKNEMVTFLK